MTARYICQIVLLLSTSLSLTGCCFPGAPCPGECSNQLWNATSLPMQDVGIRWFADGQEQSEEPGGLGSCLEQGGGAYFGALEERIPHSVTAYWKTSDGKQHVKTVEVASQVPEATRFIGTIVYEFYNNDVAIVPVPQWLEDRNQRLGKNTIPLDH